MKLVLIRHGQSLWNKQNRFTGWHNPDLSEEGKKEALEAALKLKEENIEFEQAYTSYLLRAIKTLWILLENLNREWISVEKTWKLNERHYGLLEGLNKQECAEKYGKEQALKWRRSFEQSPPAAAKLSSLKRFQDVTVPQSESLKQTQKRVLEFWNDNLTKKLNNNSSVLICAHGNSLRSLIKFLEEISDEDIFKVNVPTATPIVYELDSSFKPLSKKIL